MLILICMNFSHAASFDCAKAGTKVEKLICSTTSLNKLDSDLAEIYKDALRKDPATRQEQLSWIKERNKCADAACLETSYKERMDELTNFIVRSDRSNLSSTQTAKVNPIERPPYPSVYGECLGALSAQLKLTGGKLSSQKAVDFHNTWTPFSDNLRAEVKKGGGCTGNLSDSQLLACYNKILPNRSDAQFMFKANIGYEAVIEKPASSANLTIAKICGSLVMETAPAASSTDSRSSSSSSSTQSSSGTVTRIDTSTGNLSITGYARVTVGKSTSITVNGSRVKDEGDLMIGDRCTVRMESTDLYARNLICNR